MLIVVSLFGCDAFTDKSQGEIVYDIIYLDEDATSKLVNILPDEMSFKFKGNKTLMEMKISMGWIGMSVLSDVSSHKVVYMGKMMTKKYALPLDSANIGDFEPILNIDINPIKDTIMLDYDCTLARACFENESDTFNICYTNELNIPEPNWYTPFKNVNGVLLDYTAKFQNMKVRMVAREIIFKEIDDSEFKIPKGFVRVDIKTMKDFLPI